MPNSSTLQLSLADVARLAGVRRPVASMWRSRVLSGLPFPRPVAVVAGQERFDAYEIADYLAATGRGNNATARDDLAAHAQFAAPAGLSDDTLFEGITALLCLVVASGESAVGLDSDDLLALAAGVDPDDTYLLREITALGAAAPRIAAHADDLADASYNAAAAFELALRQRVHHGLPGYAAVALHPDAPRLVARVAAALATDAGWEAPAFVDVTDGSVDLLLATTGLYAAELAPSVATLALDTACARLARRRLRVHDLHRVDVTVDAVGDYSIARTGDGAVHVLQLPSAGDSSMSDVRVIDTIGDLVVQLAAESRVVVLGPASALADRPATKELDQARGAILRGGRLRAVVRLPNGLLVRSPSKALALWVLGPAHAKVPIADRWTVIGDLTQQALSDGTTDDLVTDVLAAMASPRSARSHAFRFARRVATSTLLAGRKALVDNPVRRETKEARGSTLGDLVSSRRVRIVPGQRIASADILASGRRLIGVDEVVGARPVGSRAVDPVTFAAAYPRSRYTEPGDVVFCTAPRVAAWVDRDGGSVVLSPARVVRIVHDPDRARTPLLPDVIAADINSVAAESGGRAKDWRRWHFRLVPQHRLDALAQALAAIETERTELCTRLAALDREAHDLIDGQTSTGTDPRTHREEGP